MSRRWCPALLALGLAACAGEGVAPSVSGLALTAGVVPLGRPVFASFQVEDPDGDLDAGFVRLSLRSIDDPGRDAIESTIGISQACLSCGREEDGGDPTRARLLVGLAILGDVPAGRLALELVVEDEAGHRSQPAVAGLQLRRPSAAAQGLSDAR
jgi:hypothetical protein